ncbi:MAG TPA: CBS domain-containing protein [Actinomycetota bacterium]|nr:CBS domain-containing protein [Actinomycetota bacterium]
MATLDDIMTREVFTAEPGTPVAEVAARMLKGRVGSAVVTQGRMLLGIFTERDVLRAAASGSDLTSSPVSEWMTPDPVTVVPETDADEAAEMMLTHGFRHLPVMQGGALAGIVSLRDILSIRIARPR